jgi:uncharacterized protein (DUF736 family)
MTEQESKGSAPTYSGDGIAVWVNTTKDGKPYLNVKLAGHNTVTAFLVEKKEDNSSSLTPEQQARYDAYVQIGLPHDVALRQVLEQ